MSKEQMVDTHTRRLVAHLKQLKAPPTTAFWYNLQKSDMERFRRMAYTAAKRGLLEADFPFWTMVANASDKNQYTLAAVAARYNKLPKGFCGWNVAVSCAGRYDPIASYCANKNTLPEDFDQWDLWSRKRREHVAHTMARKHRLPESANKPEIMALTCGHGTPVAQTAALLKTLPSNYRDWGYSLPCGLTVGEVNGYAEKSELVKQRNTWNDLDLLSKLAQVRARLFSVY